MFRGRLRGMQGDMIPVDTRRSTNREAGSKSSQAGSKSLGDTGCDVYGTGKTYCTYRMSHVDAHRSCSQDERVKAKLRCM